MTRKTSPINDRARELIRQKREKYGTPYTHLSNQLRGAGTNLSPETLKRIEAGTRRTTIDELVAILDALDITMTELLGDHPIMRGTTQ